MGARDRGVACVTRPAFYLVLGVGALHGGAGLHGGRSSMARRAGERQAVRHV